MIKDKFSYVELEVLQTAWDWEIAERLDDKVVTVWQEFCETRGYLDNGVVLAPVHLHNRNLMRVPLTYGMPHAWIDVLGEHEPVRAWLARATNMGSTELETLEPADRVKWLGGLNDLKPVSPKRGSPPKESNIHIPAADKSAAERFDYVSKPRWR